MRSLLIGTMLALAPPVLSAQEVATVAVDPPRASLTAGETLQFAASARAANGDEVEGASIVWFAVPFGAGGIEPDGTFHALRPGLVSVFAIAAGTPGVSQVDVAPKPPAAIELELAPGRIVVGGIAVLEALPVTEDGDPRSNLPVTYLSLRREIASVDANGVVVGKRPGTGRIAVEAGGARSEIDFQVIENPVRSLTVNGPASVRTGEVARFEAAAFGGREQRLPDAPVRWAVSGAGAAVYTDGAFVAERPGTYVVTAAVGEVAASATIAVSPRVHARRFELVAHVPFGDLQPAEAWAIGDALYVSTINNRLYAFDISDPTNPVKVDSIVVDANLINDVSTTADGSIGVITREGASTRKNGIIFLDLSDPLHPSVLSEYTETVSGGVHSAYIDGRRVYLTDDATGSLRVIDFEDPTAPHEVARWDVGDLIGSAPTPFGEIALGQYLHDVQVVDGIAYLAYWRHGLVILDVGAGLEGGSPEDPKLISTFNYDVTDFYPRDMLAGTHAVFRYGNYVFVGDEVLPIDADVHSRDRVRTLGRVHVIDVSDIYNPRKVAEYNVREMGSHNMWVEDDVMYIGYYEGGMRAVDVSGELRGDLMAQGREIGSIWTGSPDGFRPNLPMAWGAQPHNGYVFTSDMNSGVWVGKLTSPPTP